MGKQYENKVATAYCTSGRSSYRWLSIATAKVQPITALRDIIRLQTVPRLGAGLAAQAGALQLHLRLRRGGEAEKTNRKK
jgi:hypothetical protein